MLRRSLVIILFVFLWSLDPASAKCNLKEKRLKKEAKKFNKKCLGKGFKSSLSGCTSADKSISGKVEKKCKKIEKKLALCGFVCSETEAKVDGGWSDYGDWTECSAKCNGGTQTRTKTCTNPAPAHGGADCVGEATETQNCNEHVCPLPVDGGWSDYGDWTECSAECNGGKQTRTKTCTNPAPAHGGADCVGEATETQNCNERECPVDGGWSDFRDWSECSAECDGGTQSRTRVCDSPAPNHGGAECSGAAKETRTCNTEPCSSNRKISISKYGTQYITTDSWQVSVSVSSEEPPKSVFVTLGGTRTGQTLKLMSEEGDVRAYTFALSYDFERRAGGGDGTYAFEAVFDDGETLKTDELTIIARLALTESEDVKRIFVAATRTETIARTCEYSGVDTPQEVQWWIEEHQVIPDSNYVINEKKETVEGESGNYLIIKSTMNIQYPAWQDGGIYTCKFLFDDGNNVEVSLPSTMIIEGTGLKSCVTIFDGNMQLTCNFQSKETVEGITWQRWKEDISAEEYSTGNFEDNKMTSVLTTTGASSTNSGRFYCSATVAGEEQTYRMHTDVRFVTLTITETPVGPHYAGSQVQIVCEQSGRFEDRKILKDGIDTGDTDRHRLTVSAETAGKYTCTASAINVCEEVQTTAITVSGDDFIEITAVKPSVIEQPQNIIVSTGLPAVFSCTVPGVPGATTKITWHKEGSDNILWPRNNFDDVEKRWVSVLTITSAQLTHVGNYNCKATYGEEEVESDFASLSLLAAPSGEVGLFGGQARLTCYYLGAEKVEFELKTDDYTGDISNVAMEMHYEYDGDGGVHYSIGIATFTALTEANKGYYCCQIKGEAVKSEGAELQVLSFSMQPQDSWTVSGGTATFTIQLESFEWEGVTVSWEKCPPGENIWETVTPQENKYLIQSGESERWYSFINILNYDVTTEATKWRAKLTFPNVGNKLGGDLISNEAEVKIAGETTVTVNKADTFEGTTFTLICTFTAEEKPDVVKVMLDSRRQMEWEDGPSVRYTFENNVARFSVESEARFFYSGKEIGCTTTVSDTMVSAFTNFYMVNRNCPTLTRTNGKIDLTDKTNESGTIIGKMATLTCDSDYNYQAYSTPIVVECLFSEGRYNEELTTCVKVIPIDYSKIKVGIFFKGMQAYCSDPETAFAIESILRAPTGQECGFRNMGFPCIENNRCTLMTTSPDEPRCQVTNANGGLGVTISGTFKLNEDVATDNEARNDPASEYSGYVQDGNNILSLVTSKFFRCVAA